MCKHLKGCECLNIQKEFYIYALIDPRNNEVFYIGKARRYRGRRMERFGVHMADAKKGRNQSNTKKFRRLVNILKAGFSEVKYLLIDETNDLKKIDKFEIRYIYLFKKYYELDNLTEGGTGGITWAEGKHPMLGRKMSAEHCAKLSAVHKGIPNTHFKGAKHSEESRKKMSQSLKKRFKNKINHPRYTILTLEEERLIIGLRDEGVGCRTIGKIIGYSDTVVKRFLGEKRLPLNVRKLKRQKTS
jgi:hypothetical protein